MRESDLVPGAIAVCIECGSVVTVNGNIIFQEDYIGISEYIGSQEFTIECLDCLKPKDLESRIYLKIIIDRYYPYLRQTIGANWPLDSDDEQN